MRQRYTLNFLKCILAFILAFYASPVMSNVSPPTFQIVTSLTSFDGRNVSSWSGGGGPRQNISVDSGHPFANREMGGADRSGIQGTRAFGSGYPYGAQNTSTIAGRPFPFGVWPIYWGDNIKDSNEYGDHLDGVRPGGPLVVQAISSTTQYWNSTETYHILTDKDTALAIMTSFGTWCHVTPAWPIIFNPTTAPIKIENVILYYRASSFAFAFSNYTNSFALNTTTDAPITDSDPLPESILYSPFRQCLEGVIANALPIMDRVPKKKNNLGVILGVIFGIFGIPIICCFGVIITKLFEMCRR